jgi:hypothetical protein
MHKVCRKISKKMKGIFFYKSICWWLYS